MKKEPEADQTIKSDDESTGAGVAKVEAEDGAERA